MLLIYFDEQFPKNCGICDVCLQKTKSGLTNYEFEEIKSLLTKSFSEKTQIRLKELIDELSVYFEDSEKIIIVVRFLIDEGLLHLENDTLSMSEIKQ